MIIQKPYNRERAVEYAKTWALSRNPLFYEFTGIGGNCTNFVSQCLLAGSCTMNYTPGVGWYYISPDDRAPAWSSVESLYDFLTQKFVQYANSEGDWYHTVIITGMNGDEILVSAQSNDALDRPISSYDFATARFLHIEGVNVSLDDDTCYSILLRGGSEG